MVWLSLTAFFDIGYMAALIRNNSGTRTLTNNQRDMERERVYIVKYKRERHSFRFVAQEINSLLIRFKMLPTNIFCNNDNNKNAEISVALKINF